VELEDLQGNVLAGYGNGYAVARYCFLRVDAPEQARRWLAAVTPRVTTAARWNGDGAPAFTVNVALSWTGLGQLGVPEPILCNFPEEFRVGMAARASTLGDVGVSAPAEWENPRAKDDRVLGREEHHVLVTLYGREPAALARAREVSVALGEDGAVTSMVEQPAELLGDPNTEGPGREHFGYADGFGQPTIRGNAGPWDRPGNGTARWRNCWTALAPGEFVLGYRAEDGTKDGRVTAALRRSGTYTVVRKLEQDVAAFTAYLREQAKGNAAREEWVASRLLGRWRDGTPVEVSPDRNDSGLAADYGPGGRINDFRYRDDLEGLKCPLGAHIRRANPRDSFSWRDGWMWPDARLTKRHRIIRRSMPYGPRPADPAREDGRSRGLMFVCHQASIERQFEVIQGQWLADGDAFWLGDQRDLLTSGKSPAAQRKTGMIIEGRPPVFLPEPSRPLVVTRGGGYFFTPGIDALHTIAAGDWA
jgi:Dyp-type peroxidase family